MQISSRERGARGIRRSLDHRNIFGATDLLHRFFETTWPVSTYIRDPQIIFRLLYLSSFTNLCSTNDCPLLRGESHVPRSATKNAFGPRGKLSPASGKCLARLAIMIIDLLHYTPTPYTHPRPPPRTTLHPTPDVNPHDLGVSLNIQQPNAFSQDKGSVAFHWQLMSFFFYFFLLFSRLSHRAVSTPCNMTVKLHEHTSSPASTWSFQTLLAFLSPNYYRHIRTVKLITLKVNIDQIFIFISHPR